MSETEIAVIMNELKHIRQQNAEIKEHVMKTNGRVNKLEHWRTFLGGCWVTVTIFWGLYVWFAS